MYSLSHVIALLDGSLARLVRTIAWRIRHAGPVNLGRTTKTGNDFSAQTMLLQHLWLPVKPQPKKNRKAAQRISVASKSTSKKRALVLTVKSPQEDGSSIQTPASKTRQPVSQVQKPRKAVAQFTQLEQSQTHEQALAQTHTDNQFGVLGKHKAVASKTRQPALLESKAKQKPVERTKAASKRTQGKAPAQTRTVRRHGADGK